MSLRTVAIGTRVQPGAFGGGNEFARVLAAWLQQRGVQVVFDLQHPAIDAIIVTSIKPWARAAAFDAAAALKYAARHPDTALVLRVNECDQRKGHRLPLLNRALRLTISRVDHTVFVSRWLRDLLLPHDSPDRRRSSVIASGADPAVFHPTGTAIWNEREPLRIVTHHWSSSWYKGWDIYQAVDDWLGTPAGRAFRFTFIGNPWPQAALRHTQVLPPQSGQQLAHTLKEHHVYISGSQHEPAGMHAVEAVACGLPIIWRDSGSLKEYCAPYGPGFTGPSDVIAALQHMQRDYYRWQTAAANHDYTAKNMCRQYLDLCSSLTPSPRRFTYQNLDLRVQQLLLWLRDAMQ